MVYWMADNLLCVLAGHFMVVGVVGVASVPSQGVSWRIVAYRALWQRENKGFEGCHFLQSVAFCVRIMVDPFLQSP